MAVITSKSTEDTTVDKLRDKLLKASDEIKEHKETIKKLENKINLLEIKLKKEEEHSSSLKCRLEIDKSIAVDAKDTSLIENIMDLRARGHSIGAIQITLKEIYNMNTSISIINNIIKKLELKLLTKEQLKFYDDKVKLYATDDNKKNSIMQELKMLKDSLSISMNTLNMMGSEDSEAQLAKIRREFLDILDREMKLSGVGDTNIRNEIVIADLMKEFEQNKDNIQSFKLDNEQVIII